MTSTRLRSGVADSIEQHTVKLNEPGGQNSLGVSLKGAEYDAQR